MVSLEGNFRKNAPERGILGTFWAQNAETLYLSCLGALTPKTMDFTAFFGGLLKEGVPRPLFLYSRGGLWRHYRNRGLAVPPGRCSENPLLVGLGHLKGQMGQTPILG